METKRYTHDAQLSARGKVRAVVVKLRDDQFPESPWIAACMSLSTYDAIGGNDWEAWRREALPMVLADSESYEVREVTISVPQAQLDALFAVDVIDGEVERETKA